MLQRCKQTDANDDSKLLGETLDQLQDDNKKTVNIDEEVLVSGIRRRQHCVRRSSIRSPA